MTNPAVQYGASTDTAAPPSPIIWGDCPWLEIEAQVAQGAGGYKFWDDFINAPAKEPSGKSSKEPSAGAGDSTEGK